MVKIGMSFHKQSFAFDFVGIIMDYQCITTPSASCDTRLIATALERRFPASKGYSKSARGTIFPRRNGTGKVDKGLINAYTKYYLEAELFPPATNHLPYERLPADFLQDREQVNSAMRFP